MFVRPSCTHSILFAFLQIRELELALLLKAGYLSVVQQFFWSCAPFLVSLATFGTYTGTGNELTPADVRAIAVFRHHVHYRRLLSLLINFALQSQAFVALALFNLLRFPLSMLPMLIRSVRAFLLADECVLASSC